MLQIKIKLIPLACPHVEETSFVGVLGLPEPATVELGSVGHARQPVPLYTRILIT